MPFWNRNPAFGALYATPSKFEKPPESTHDAKQSFMPLLLNCSIHASSTATVTLYEAMALREKRLALALGKGSNESFEVYDRCRQCDGVWVSLYTNGQYTALMRILPLLAASICERLCLLMGFLDPEFCQQLNMHFVPKQKLAEVTAYSRCAYGPKSLAIAKAVRLTSSRACSELGIVPYHSVHGLSGSGLLS